MTRTSRPRPTRARKPRVATLPQLLATAVEADPTGTAVVFADAVATRATLSYAELDERSTRLARLLISRGLGPEDVVAVAVPRSLESVVAVWAVAKSGAAFVPVDPGYPRERIAHMLGDSGTAVGLTVTAVQDYLPASSTRWLCLDSAEVLAEADEFSADAVTYADRVRPLRPEHPAYLIYTSGSTGTPKGVVVTHAGLSSFCDEQRDRYRIGPGSRTLHFASPSFDASILELLLAVGGPATMVVVSPDVFGGAEFAAVLEREAVTHAFVTPAALASVDPAGLAALRVVVVGGEACPPDLVRRWVVPVAGGSREFFNGYGPTETTIMTNITAPMVPGVPVTIGAPIRGVTEYVLDERLYPVPTGAIGELYIAGPQLARGYHARAGLTASRFVASPFGAADSGDDAGEPVSGDRLYRTGDIVRRAVSGELEYVGRNDFQVKIRGFRIELGEIDAVLAAHPSVDFAATTGYRLESGNTILAAYVHAAPGAAVDTEALIAAAERSLPAHMVPSTVTVLDHIPLTPSGKLDRAALPAPQVQTCEYRSPEGRLEELVAAVFAELLAPANPVGADDDFFALGGNSLIATRVAARLGALIAARVPARLLFDAPTPAALAARVALLEGAGGRLQLAPMTRPDPMPLSPAQQRVWFLNQFDPTSAADNIPLALRLTGQLNSNALRAAIVDVLERHEALRTVYPAVDGIGHQLVLQADQVPLDLTPYRIDEDEIQDWLAAFAFTGFDVATEVPLRVALARLAPDQHVVAVVAHHIAFDGTSVGPFVRDLMVAFLARRNRAVPAWTPLPVQYADYTVWQRAVLGDETNPESVAARETAFWRDTLAGLPDRLDLPTDRPRPVEASGLGAAHRFRIDPALHTRLEALAKDSGATLFMVVHAAYAVLLSRLSASSDIAVGTPVAGRGERELDALIGMFVNTLVLRTRVTPQQPFTALLAAVRDGDLAAFAHAELPFERLVELLDPVRTRAHHPLFQVALFFQNMAAPRVQLPGLQTEIVEFDGAIARFDLQLTVTPHTEGSQALGCDAELLYATDLFEHETIVGFAGRLQRLLAAIAVDPFQPVGDIELLDPAELTRILHEWNDTHAPLAPELLLDGFRSAVTQHPHRVAVSCAGEELTYAEFDAQVNRLARLLISRGVGAESMVGLVMRRSLDLVVSMYAIVTAGGAYVPVDPEHPAERIAHIIETARPVCVLTTRADALAVPERLPTMLVDSLILDGFDHRPLRFPELLRPLRPQNPAYVVFTSGSTGQPKGVAVSHAAIHNQITWMLAAYPLGPGDVYLQKTATTFDVSLWGYFMPLRTGAKLVIADPAGHRDPGYVADVIAAEQVTTTDFVPSMLTVFAAHTPAPALASLADVFVIGEELTPETVSALAEISDARVHNLYGPTEAAVSVTYWPASTEDRPLVPIGLPQWNNRVYVLDGRLRPVPAGVPGELYLAGEQLARGYVRRPDLTSERFVASPFTPGARMYRTGDLVQWRGAEDGLPPRLMFLGRTDFQVKFRGQRIELGEIETALLARPGVSQAVAVVTPSPLGDQLAGYLVAAPGVALDVDRIRAALVDVLPPYMVPAALTVLDALPLNSSGKLDRAALPAPAFQARTFRAPATPVEQVVARVFAEVLGADRVGADDDFFGLGGNSLNASQAAARLGAALGARVPVRALFESPSVSGLAAGLESHAQLSPTAVLGSLTRPEQIPLSPAQQRMWFLNRYDYSDGGTASAAYNLPIAVRLTGTLDTAALAAALDDVVARHEVLRTVYPLTADGPVQVVLPAGTGLGVEPERLPGSEIEAAVRELARTAFDVTTEVPIRVRLLEVADGAPGAAPEYVLAAVVHHIAADGSSAAPLVRDVMSAYVSRAAGVAPGWAPLPVQYSDYSVWQRAMLGSEDDPESTAATQIGYWRRELAGLPEQLALPADRPRPPAQSFAGGRIDIRFGAELHAALQALGRAHDATLFMVVHTAFATLLARLSGTGDIAIGTPVAGRGEAALDDLVGMFANTVVFRTRVDTDLGFSELLMRQREIDIEAYAHADVPFERLVEVLDPVRSAARHPLFQVGLSFQNVARAAFELPGLSVATLDFEAGVSQYDLHLIVSDHYDETGAPAGLTGVLTYASDLFDAATAAGIAGRFQRLLAEIVAAPRTPVGDLPLLDDAERAAVLVARNATACGITPGVTLASILGSRLATDPGVALVGADGTVVSYRELAERVNRLARHLIALGVGPESRVALAMRRSVDLVVAVYAVAVAGGAYVPVDPDQPAERVNRILAVANPVCVLSTSDVAVAGVTPVLLDQLDLSGYPAGLVSDAERREPLRVSNTAYVVFTSGSTGTPKGVAVPHSAVVNQLVWKVTEFELGADEAVLLKTAATFDLSVWELWTAVVCGGRLVIAAADSHLDPGYLNQLIARERVTTLHVVPSALDALLTESEGTLSGSLRRVLAIGEPLPPAVAQRFRRGNGAGLFNLYGPTEAAVSITAHAVTEADQLSVPIGRPEWNSQVFVLDGRLQPVPDGVVGELYLAGAQLARGYAGRPDLTAERFVANPFGDGRRMYRTGDLATWNAFGELEYRGRTDAQLKIRGFRIEPGEVEAALLALPGITQAAVRAASGARTGDHLVAYLVGPDVDVARVKSALGTVLPSYLVPSAFVVLDALPFTVNGKLDRKALPEPGFGSAGYRAATNPVEELVAETFAAVLGSDRVGADDDFFALGGTSLLATRVVARLAAALGTRIPIRVLFEAPTVAALAVALTAAGGTGRPHVPLVPQRRPERILLSPAQQRMWFLNQFDGTSAVYNIPVAIRLSGALDVDALRAAVADLVARHEILRTVYPQTPAGPEQRVLSPAEVTVDLAGEQVGEERVAHEVRALAGTGFDVTTEVPFRTRLLQLTPTEYVLVFVAHHIAADGWSMGPLARDLMSAYVSRSGGVAPGWSPLPVQYADYALWQRTVLGEESDPDSLASHQIAYWAAELAGLPPELNLPADRPRPAALSYTGGTVALSVDPGVHAALNELARSRNATLFMVVHAALAVLLARLSGTADVAVGTPVAGRGDRDLDQLIGMFVNTLVLRTRVEPALPFTGLLAATRETDLRAFAHADLPFERLVDILAPERSTARHPLFQVALSFENLTETGFELPGLGVTALDPAVGTAKFDLQLTVREQRAADGGAGGLAIEFTYAEDLFDEETVAGFARRYLGLLAGIAADPETAVGDLPLLAAAEATDLLSRTGGPAEPARTLPDLMAAAVAANPRGIAIVVGARQFTYADLDIASSKLARRLITLGAGPDVRVAVAIPRSIEGIVALWSVAKTGAAFVPVDPTYPVARIAHLVADSGAALAVTVRSVAAGLPAVAGAGDWLILDSPEFAAQVETLPGTGLTDADRLRPLRHADAAYLIYTSGSTGVPKGVVVTHAGLANFSAEQVARYRTGYEFRALAFASPSFDASILEVLLALGSGGALIMVPPTVFGGDELAELIRATGATHAFLTPSVLATLDPAGIGDSMQVIVAGGEELPAELAARWAVRAEGSTLVLHNGYGPTEATIMGTISDPLTPDGPVTIGGPMRGVRALVLDSRLHPVPEGVCGELYLGGIGLARGYHARPDLTAARFVADPYGTAGARLYRTGDLVRWQRGTGVLEFLGRNDFQVQVRGLRIELGEIDAALAARPEVGFAVTVGQRIDTGATVLVSYVRPADENPLDTAELTTALAATLPEYLVPAAIVVLDEIPLTPSGKLDRAALPGPVLEPVRYRAPQTEAEQAVAAVVAEVLGVDRVGLDDDFFALGGDSIMSVQVVSRARAKGVTFTARDVFEHRTVAALAAAAQVETADSVVPHSGPVPLLPDAVRLLRQDPQAREVRAIALDIPVGYPLEQVDVAVRSVCERHPLLAAHLDATGSAVPVVPGTAVPVLPGAGLPVVGDTTAADAEVDATPRLFIPLTLPTTAVRHLVASDEAVEMAVRGLGADLDPAAGRNIGFALVAPAAEEPAQRADDAAAVLVVVANGLVVDDAAWRILVDELSAAWSGGHAVPAAADAAPGRAARALADLATDPVVVGEMSWWRQALGAVPAEPAVPPVDPARRGRVGLVLTSEGAAAVAAVAEMYHTALEDVLLTALVLALDPGVSGTVDSGVAATARLLGPVVRLLADGRSAAGPDAADAVGGFTAGYPVVPLLTGIDVDDAMHGGPAAGRAIAQVKEARREVPSGGIGYGLLRYLNPATGAELAQLPQGRIGLRYRDLRPARSLPELAASDLLVDLTVDATESGLVARFDYAAGILGAEPVKELAGAWVRALGGLAEHGNRLDSGGFTPSDFPLVRPAQADIDRLQREFPRLAAVWPVTPLQAGMLFHAALADASVDVYLTQFGLDLGAAVDERRLREAAQAVLDRHDNLRAAFADDEAGNPLQVIVDGVEIPWRTVDLTDVPEERRAAELDAIAAADYAERFDMRTPPLLRFTLIRLTPDAYRLLVTTHHILVDGWSVPLLLQDLFTVYTLGPRSRRLPRVPSYGDYLAWLVAQDADAARAAWRAALAGLDEPTPLAPVDPARELTGANGTTGFELSPADTTELTKLAARLGVTVNTVVQAAWGLLIGRSVDRDDVVFGATVSGRPPALPGVEAMVGLFLNAVPVRVRLGVDDTLAGLLRRLQAEQAALLEHHFLGLSEIQRATGMPGLFDTLVVFESFPVDRESLGRAETGAQLPVVGSAAVTGTHYPVTVVVVLDTCLRVSLKYLTDVFDEAAATALAHRLRLLIGRFVTDPQTRVAEVDALLPADRAELTVLNATDAPELLSSETLLTVFDRQVARTPHAPAVFFGDTRLEYVELDVRARELARELQARGVRPEVPVVVAMRRSIELVVALHAVLRSGGVYVPVDPDHPAERIRAVLDSVRPVCVLTTRADGFGTTAAPVVVLDDLEPTVAAVPREFPAAQPDSPACVLYTSGSTGAPKGVVLTNRQLVAQFRWAQRNYPHDNGDVVLHKTPVTFDISLWELLWPLQTGAAIAIAGPDGHRDPGYLSELIERRSVTTVHFVPSMLDVFLDAEANPALAQGYPSLRRVFAAGEALSGDAAGAFALALPNVALVNWYGPAEATVVTAQPVHGLQSASVPIGVPVANTRVSIVDRHLREVPPGAPGELYLSGVQLARGYLGQPALTAERFVAGPGGSRRYRTGDVVRLRDGVLEYLGRTDCQVKLRGQRVELGEIEAALTEDPAVRHAAVALVSGPAGDRLVGYVVPAAGAVADPVALRARTRESLPAYMVPALVVVLDELPLTASGKLDRRALPVPSLDTRPFRAPSTDLERTVADVFAEGLGVARVGLDDDFFDLGGDSLIATRVAGRLRRLTGAAVRVQWFFTGSTVAALSAKLHDSLGDSQDYDADSESALDVVLRIRSEGEGAPLFCLHPMYGLAWGYAGLAQYLPDRPLLGVQSPALTEDGFLPNSLQDMAVRYADEIRAVQPSGPYHLVGWSLGGVLAHAVAVRLQEAGESVALLALLDSHPDIDVTDFRAAIREALAELGIGAESLVGDGDVHELSEEALAVVHAQLPADLAVLTPDRVRRIYRSAVRSAELIATHRPQVFRGRLDYFSALGSEQAVRSWRFHVDGSVVNHPVSVPHAQMTTAIALAEIGPVLGRLLAEPAERPETEIPEVADLSMVTVELPKVVDLPPL
ncbi:amino acid adenylation domain-containing protein [Nocardia stercoris]|uniref:Amino acid adenylation domain-containing protein n=1 Tax=Nocardia stercoris TaxID=2483361 RepID=A0A3M2L4M6_9NOCA|nr:non-ribosomal peptide synthetase [Nocardia stercoris]RMI31926.1 amino acid adenylation domain-containing protein [Nocardia stercoris]